MKIKLSNLDPETRKKIMAILADKDAGAESKTEGEDSPQQHTWPVSPAKQFELNVFFFLACFLVVLVVYYALKAEPPNFTAQSTSQPEGQIQDTGNSAAGRVQTPKGAAPAAQMPQVAIEEVKPGPPELDVITPAQNQEIRSQELKVVARTAPLATVRYELRDTIYNVVNQGQLNVAPDGSIKDSVLLPLKDSVMDIILYATNAYGTTKKKIPLKDPAASLPLDWRYRLYYVSEYANYQYHTYRDLCRALEHVPKLHTYIRDYFDCSNLSSELWAYLDTCDFQASIVNGDCPWDPNQGLHAWVIVYTTDRGRVAVEATKFTDEQPLGMDKVWSFIKGTGPGVIMPENENTDNPTVRRYYQYKHEFHSMFEAIRYCGSDDEWNWWSR